MYVRTVPGLGESSNAWPGLGQPALPQVASVRFRNTGLVDPQNCCAACTNAPATEARMNLGVGLRGNGAVNLRAANGMELTFTISGHRPGIEYDIQRTRRNALWERRAGAWTRLGARPMGTWDDHHARDECLRLRNNRIFVIDRPGWNAIAVPAPAATIFRSNLFGAQVATHADATEIVSRFSFAEWVNARSLAEGIPWTRLAWTGQPQPGRLWHSIVWLVRDPPDDITGQWVLGPRSEIRLGPLSWNVISTAPA
jgi:hypothetical protein